MVVSLACVPKKALQNSGVKYGLLRRGDLGEFLKKLKAAEEMAVCVFFEGFEAEDARRSGQGVMASLERAKRFFSSKVIEFHLNSAVHEWNKVFRKANPSYWTLERIRLSIHFEGCGEKPRSEPDSARWPSAVLGAKTKAPVLSLVIANPQTVKETRAYADMATQSIWWPVHWRNESGEFDLSLRSGKFLLAHELGHIFGLSDTYNELEGGALEGQPRALMNNHRGGFSIDEVAAGRTLLRFLESGEFSCEPGYRPFRYQGFDEVHPASQGSFFCVLEGSSLVDSYGVLSKVEEEDMIAKEKRAFQTLLVSGDGVFLCRDQQQKRLAIRFLQWTKKPESFAGELTIWSQDKVLERKNFEARILSLTFGVYLDGKHEDGEKLAFDFMRDFREVLTEGGEHFREEGKVRKKMELTYQGSMGDANGKFPELNFKKLDCDFAANQ